MQTRCPQCSHPVEVLDDSVFSDVTCSSCGSHFNLVENETMSYRADEHATIGHFELQEIIGAGSFGTVWKALDTELDRTVAVKIPRKDILDAKESELFFREARAAAQLKHPNIVSVHEVGREGDTIYLVSDLVEGLRLADWLTAQRLTCQESSELCLKIAEALEHAHQAGVIHRDLKPSNILIDADGEPHIMDFGLAKRESGEITMTMEGQILGTPAYMSPEQAKGEGHNADARSDVYSLGVILFEVMTGERPFRGNTRMLIHQMIHEEAPSPRQINNQVPKDLETICLKCLEKEPGRRYQTAGELADDLRHFIAGEPILARPVSRVERVWRWCCRNKLVTALTATAVLLLVGLAVGGTTAAIIVNEQKNIAEENERIAIRERSLAKTSELRANQNKELAEQKEQEANENALRALKAQQAAERSEQAAERSENVAKQQSRLALRSLNSLVTNVQTQLKDTAGTFELKRALLQTALDGLQKVARTEESDGYTADLSIAIAHQRMGKILEYLGRPEEARAEYRRFHQVIIAVSGPTPSIGAKDNLAISLTTLGDISLLLGDREKAGEYYLQAHDLRKEVAEKSTKKTRSQVRLATSFVKLGDASDHQETEKYYYESLRMRKELAENAPETDRPNRLRDVWITHNKIGDMLLRHNRGSEELLERAENHYREAFDIARQLHKRNRISPQGRQDFAASYVNIGNLMLRRGNRSESIRVYENALQLLEPVARDDPENIDVQGSYVLLLARCRRLQKAETKAQDLQAMAPQSYRNLYNVACCYSLCAAAVDEGKRKREYIRQALDALDQAIQNGMHDTSYIKNDSDFDAIRGEERLKQLQLFAEKRRADQTRSARNIPLKKSSRNIR